jgi:guanylate kinase
MSFLEIDQAKVWEYRFYIAKVFYIFLRPENNQKLESTLSNTGNEFEF